jgi:ribosomal protein L32
MKTTVCPKCGEMRFSKQDIVICDKCGFMDLSKIPHSITRRGGTLTLSKIGKLYRKAMRGGEK